MFSICLPPLGGDAGGDREWRGTRYRSPSAQRRGGSREGGQARQGIRDEGGRPAQDKGRGAVMRLWSGRESGRV